MDNKPRQDAKHITKYRQFFPYDRMAAHVDSLMGQRYLYNEDLPDEYFAAISGAIGDVVDALHSAEEAQDLPSELVKVTNTYIVVTDAIAVFKRLNMDIPKLLQQIQQGLEEAKKVLGTSMSKGGSPDASLPEF